MKRKNPEGSHQADFDSYVRIRSSNCAYAFLQQQWQPSYFRHFCGFSIDLWEQSRLQEEPIWIADADRGDNLTSNDRPFSAANFRFVAFGILEEKRIVAATITDTDFCTFECFAARLAHQLRKPIHFFNLPRMLRKMLQLRDIAVRPARNTCSGTGSTRMMVRLTNAERDTILAALRRWQSYPAAREADSIATDGGKHRPLNNAEIERVCKRLTNVEGKPDAAPLLHRSNNGARVRKASPGGE
jgi:hypothetical protein